MLSFQIEKVEFKLRANSECLKAIGAVTELAKLLHEVDALSPTNHPLQYTEAILDLENKLNQLEVSID